MTAEPSSLPSTLIATAANAEFFIHLAGLLLSLEKHRGSQAISVGLLDLGLTAAQREWLAPRIDHFVEPGWDLAVPESWREEKPHLRALTARPFLPRHFPGFELYLWIDADVWLQDWQGAALYLRGAERGGLAVTTHTDRCYYFLPNVYKHRHRQFRRAYGKQVADTLAPRHHLNAGVFAASAESVIWDHWAEAYAQAIKNSEGRMTSDQTALNLACYREDVSVQLLPALCNWQCHLAIPTWDPRSGKFCEPQLPHAPISMLHLTAGTKDRHYDIRCLDGQHRRMMLRNPALASAILPDVEPVAETDVAP